MLNIGQVQDLLVSYSPTYTTSQEQAYPLEMLKEPVSGGDAYYEDFTDGLRRFAQARSLVLGGSAGAAIVMDLAGRGGGADPMGGDESDDELDAEEPSARVIGGSILDFAITGGDGGAPAPKVSPITGAVVDRAAGDGDFSDDVQSLFAYVKRVGGAPGAPRGDGALEREFVMINGNGDTDDGGGEDDTGEDDTGEDADEYASEYVDGGPATEERDLLDEEDASGVRGAMDETERELEVAQQDEAPDSTILSAIVETSSRSS